MDVAARIPASEQVLEILITLGPYPDYSWMTQATEYCWKKLESGRVPHDHVRLVLCR